MANIDKIYATERLLILCACVTNLALSSEQKCELRMTVAIEAYAQSSITCHCLLMHKRNLSRRRDWLFIQC